MPTQDSDRQVVFIDSRVPDLQDLVDGAAPGVAVFVLDPSTDGVQQIADILAANDLTDLASVSIVGHGAAGEIELGSTVLNDADLSEHARALAQIGSTLGPDGNLQLYSCDTASGATGQQFIADLSQAANADVAASAHDIGVTPAGENWTLDTLASPTGQVAPAHAADLVAPFTAAAEAGFSGTLSVSNTELWIAATGGGDQNLIIHSDDTGNGTASNIGELFSPGSANNPSDVNLNDQLAGIDLFQLDTQDGLYFIATQNNQISTAPGQILKGSLTSALANPTATPTYTTLFSTTAPGAITGIAVDPDNAELYFEFGHNFEKVSYNGGAVTTLGAPSDGAFLDGVALDLPHHIAYFLSGTSHITTTTTKGGLPDPSDPHGNIHYNDVVTGSIYETSSLSTNSTSVTITKLIDLPTSDGAPANGVGTVGIAVDTVTGRLFFTTKTINGQGEGGVFWIDPTTDPTHTVHTVFRQTGTAGSVLGNGILQSIEVDDATGKYYLSVLGSNGEGGAIYVGNLTDSNVRPTLFETMPTFNSGTIQPGPEGFSLDNAPTFGGTAGATFTESTSNPASSNNTPVGPVTGASPSDTDNDKLASAKAVVSGGFAGSGDSLYVLDGSTHRISGTFTGTSITVGETTDGNGNATLTLSGADTLANYQTVLSAVKFTSTSDNPTNYGANTSRTITYTVSDGLLSSTAFTSTVTVVGTNDAPTISVGAGDSASLALTETNAGLSGSHTLTVADPDSLSQTITKSLSSHTGPVGSISDTTLAGFFTVGSPVSTSTGTGTITYTFNSGAEAFNFLGAGQTLTLNYNVHDVDSADTGASQPTDQAVTVTIAGTNDAPVVTAGGTLAYTENQAATVLASGASVTDIDSADFNTGSLTVQVTANGHAEDQLSILTDATVTVSGSTVSVGGNAVGTINATHNGANGASLEIDFNSANATPAAVTTLMDHIAYADNSDDPSTAARTVTFTINDGDGIANGGVATGSATSSVTLTAVNDAPVNHVPGAQSINEDVALVFNTAQGNLISVSDVDVESGTETVTLSVAHGALTLATTAGLSFTTGDGTADATMTFSGTLTNINTALNGLSYLGTANFNGGDTLTVTTNDNGNTGTGGAQQSQDTVGILVNPVNDPPNLQPDTTTAASYTENAAATALFAGEKVDSPIADPDQSANYAGGSVKFQVTGGAVSGDEVVLTGSTFHISGGSIEDSANTVIGTISGNATSTVTISALTSAATPTVVDQLVESFGFTSTSDDPGNGDRTVTLTFNDGGNTGTGSALTDSVTQTVHVTPVNDPPTLSATAVNPTYTENDAGADLFSGVSVSAVEAADNIKTLTLTVSGLADGANEILHFDGSDIALTDGNSVVTHANNMDASVTVSGNTATVTLTETIFGATPIDVRIDLASFRDDGENPTPGDRVVTLTSIQDSGGTAAGGQDTTSLSIASTVTVVAVNDAPVAVASVAHYSATEQTLLDLKNTGLSVSDVDALGGTETITLSLDEGTLHATVGDSGVTIDSGNDSAALQISGTIAQLNAFLGVDGTSDLTYIDNSDNPAAVASIGLSINDNGHTGTSGPQVGTAGALIDITAVNDAPVAVAPASYLITSNVPLAITGVSFSDVDANGGAEEATFAVASGTFSTTVGAGVSVGGDGTATLTLDGKLADLNAFIAGGHLSFTGTQNTTLNITIDDLGHTGSPGHLTDSVSASILVAPTIAIGTIAGDDTVNAAEAAAGFAIGGTTTNVEDNQTVTVMIVDATSHVVDTLTAPVSGNAWSASVNAAQAQALADGNYTVKADVSNAANASAPEATHALTVDETGPALTVTGISPDTGVLANDGLTNAVDVTVSGTIDLADANRPITVFDGLNPVGFTTANAQGNWSLADVALHAGANSLTASATDAVGNSGTSAAFTATFDSVAPTLTSITVAPDTGDSNSDHLTDAATLTYTLTFSEAVTGLDLSDFTLDPSSTDTAASLQSVSGSGDTWTLTVATGGAGNEGTIAFAFNGQNVSDLAGNGFGGGAFEDAGTVTAGTTPAALALADVDGDGHLDIVVADQSGNSVSIVNFNGPSTTAAVGNAPTSVAVGDVDGDGHLDIVAANGLGNSVSVLLGNGDGTFQAQRTDATGLAPRSVTLGDVNGDGHLDIVTANGNDNDVSVLLGNGDGTFVAATADAVGTSPFSVALADVNGDGRLDIITANQSSNTVSVLLGNGNGTFQAQTTDVVGASPTSVAVGDVNGDGHLDIVTSNEGSNTVSVLLGNGNGTFQPQTTDAVGQGPFSVTLGDVNGDGRLDIVTANQTSSTVSVLLGNGDGTFQAPTTDPAGLHTTAAVLGDLNGDGRPDIVTNDPSEGVVALLLNQSQPVAAPVVTFDGIAPALTVTGIAPDTGIPADGITNAATVTVAGTIDAGDATRTVTVFDGATNLGTATLDGAGGWSLSGVTLHAGDNLLTAQATDAAGNTGTSAIFTATLDQTAPAQPTVALAHDTGSLSNDNLTNDPTLTFSTPAAGDTLLYKADAGGFSTTAPVFATDHSADGSHTVSVEEQDAAGNVSTAASLTFMLDTIAPTVTSVTAQPSSADLKAGGTVKLTVNVSENVTVTGAPTLSLNDGGTATFDVAASIATALVFDYTVLVGQNTSDLSVTGLNLAGGDSIQDAAGNNADSTGAAANPAGTLIVDTSAPGAPIEHRIVLHAATDTLSGTAEALSTVTVTLDGHALPNVTADASGIWSLDTAALSLGAYSFTATATDAAGNVSASSAAFDVDVLAGVRADYFIDTVLGGDHVLHTQVTDVATGGAPQSLTGVEALQFSDGVFANAGADLNRMANYDGGRFDDVLFQHDGDGQLTFAQMNNGAVTGFGNATAPIGNFVFGGTGDINGDGFADVFVQDPTHGGLYVAEQSGTGTPTWVAIAPGLPADFTLVGAGDLNGDGFADAVVQQQGSGTVDYAAIVNGAFSSWQPVAQNLGSFHVTGIGDVNGDGFADVVVQDQGGQNEIDYASMAGGVFSGWTQVAVAPGWQVAAVADLNGDGNADVVIRDTAPGFNIPVFANMHDGVFSGWVAAATAIDQSWQIKAVADVNNDGFADLILQQTTTGETVFATEGPNGFDHWGTIQTPPGSNWHVV